MQLRPDQVPLRIRILSIPHRLLRWLAGVGAALIWPVDFLFFLISHKVFGTLEKVEDAEFVAARTVWVLLGPLRFIRRLLMGLVRGLAATVIWPLELFLYLTARKAFALAEAFEYVGFVAGRLRWALLWRLGRLRQGLVELVERQPRFVRNVLFAPFIAASMILYICIHGFMFVVEALNLDGILFRLIHWTKLVWYPVVAVIGFVWIWCITRSKRELLWGVPVTLLVLPCVWIAGARAFKGEESIAENYRIAVTKARNDKDESRMQLFERKLAQLGADTQHVDFRTALALAQDGQYTAAYDRMRKLAPEDKPGYPGAHFWIIQNILSHRVNVPAEEGHRLMGRHLDQLDAHGIKADGLDLLRAYWLAGDHQHEEAVAMLKPLIHEMPSAAIDRMRLDLELNHLADARQDAEAVTKHMERSKRQDKSLTADDYRWWSIAEDVLGHKVRLRAIVTEWQTAHPNDKNAREALGALALGELEQFLNAPDQEPDVIAQSIQDAFATRDVSQTVKRRVIALYHHRVGNPALQSAFTKLLEKPELPPSLLETIGTEAAVEGDWGTAQRAFERAISQEPNNSVALNNLAFVLLKKGAQLDKALVASNRAIELKPDSFHLRETRGQILVKLKQWKQAVPDLEFALNGIPDSLEIHQSLAKAYEALGNVQLAAVHRQYSN